MRRRPSATPRLVLALLALGVALRGFHYLRDRAVWHDEAAVVVNVLSQGFGDLLGPLRFHEAAPPLFLWLLKATSLALGDSSLSLRLPSFLAGVASLLLLAHVAGRLLAPRAVPWAVLMFAASEQLLWHASEAKPYALDVLAATLVLAAYTWGRGRAPVQALLAFALLAPPLIFLSYPACFLFGAVLVAQLPAVWRRRQAGTWAAYGLLAAATAVPFLLLLCGPVRAQHDPVIHADWASCMPCWQRPWSVPGWAVLSSLEVCRYCCKPLGQALAPLALGGAVTLWRRGLRGWVVLLTLPVALALLAACLHRYPYGGVRVLAYAAPAVVLLIAAGTPAALDWLRARARLAVAGLVLVLLLPLGHSLWFAAFVWPEADVPAAAAYVEARRRAADPVTGNDWTHLYYFRRLGPHFALANADAPQPRERVWIVITDMSPHEGRLDLARRMVPDGWRLQEDGNFAFTSVALFARDDLRRAAR
jgi:hypothetical protein